MGSCMGVIKWEKSRNSKNMSTKNEECLYLGLNSWIIYICAIFYIIEKWILRKCDNKLWLISMLTA